MTPRKFIELCAFALAGLSLVSLSFLAGVGLASALASLPQPGFKVVAAEDVTALPSPIFRSLRVAHVVGSRSLGWADVLVQPRPESTRIGQLLVGDRVEVLSERNGWSEINLSRHSLRGWVETDVLAVSEEYGKRMVDGSCGVVRAPGTVASPEFYLPYGGVVPCRSPEDGFLEAGLPDGRLLIVEETHLGPTVLPLETVIEQVRRFRGTSYQGGGNTVAAMDSSGLIYLTFRAAGLPVPRAVLDQLKWGEPVPVDAIRPGDVAFLSTFDPTQPLPVLCLDNGQTYLEASPLRGVGVGHFTQVRNREILTVRRFH